MKVTLDKSSLKKSRESMIHYSSSWPMNKSQAGLVRCLKPGQKLFAYFRCFTATCQPLSLPKPFHPKSSNLQTQSLPTSACSDRLVSAMYQQVLDGHVRCPATIQIGEVCLLTAVYIKGPHLPYASQALHKRSFYQATMLTSQQVKQDCGSSAIWRKFAAELADILKST